MRATSIAFLKCNDITLHFADVKLTDEERVRVQAALAWLEHSGIVLVPRQHKGERIRTFEAAIADLRASVGDLSLRPS